MALHSRIREARNASGLTQEQLGKIVGCAKNTISSYESGVNDPSMDMLGRIMQALNVDANYMFQDELRERAENTASSDEMDYLIKPFRSLDAAGQNLIRTVLHLEYERCQNSPPSKDHE